MINTQSTERGSYNFFGNFLKWLFPKEVFFRKVSVINFLNFLATLATVQKEY